MLNRKKIKFWFFYIVDRRKSEGREVIAMIVAAKNKLLRLSNKGV
jgi:hypothetical protein